MELLDDIDHAPFKYILIPADITDPVVAIMFSGGKEGIFREVLKSHFSRECLLDREKRELEKSIREKTTGDIDGGMLSDAVSLSSQSYEIISLVLPTPSNSFRAVNAYIDSVGRIKGMPQNSRATRITSTDIRGDCFLSRSFDDDTDFRRMDFTMEDYEGFLACPPDARGRWNPSAALEQMNRAVMGGGGEGGDEGGEGGGTQTGSSQVTKCSNCGSTAKEIGAALMKCGGCSRVCYCNRDCQRSDWRYHKRFCGSTR